MFGPNDKNKKRVVVNEDLLKSIKEPIKKSIKKDNVKNKLFLLPKIGLAEASKAMTFGEQKYSAFNYLNDGIEYSRLLSAIWRHLTAFELGEDIDKETGLKHLAHAAATILMLIEVDALYPEKDDRCKVYAEKLDDIYEALLVFNNGNDE